MSYYSQVVLAVAFKTPEQADEVMAVYAMIPEVQTFDLTAKWARHQVKGATLLVYTSEQAKWAEEIYDDVKALRKMLTLVQEFANSRTDIGMIPDDSDKPELICTFPFAWRELEIGESLNDTRDEGDCNDLDLEELLMDTFEVERRMVIRLSE